jgi:putative ATP-dependent endonuclease of the OLD family
MRLISITVEKYRSIVKAHKIRIGDSTGLVGPNSEGKSNILRALVTAMRILTRPPMMMTVHGGRITKGVSRSAFNWDVDFPLHLQEKQTNGQSIIILEFELADDELSDFQSAVGSRLSGTLPLKIALGRNDFTVQVYKQGPGSKTLSEKSDRIADFVSKRLDFQHIPAIRTARSAEEIVEQMVELELRKLESDPDYLAALQRIAKIQQPLLNQLSESIKSTLVNFLPAVKDVRVQIPTEERFRAMRRSCRIIVDDGTATLLQHKGDGVQSLAALGIMRHASERGARGRNLVVAIEEPESHLHPRAIHELRTVLAELSGKHQIVLTTHNPLFVDRVNCHANILVNQKTARPAKSIEEVRKILGVKAADNLRHAELILVLEGEEDRMALVALLRGYSPTLKSAIDNGTLGVDTLHGASNLSYKLGLVRDALCAAHCFLDYDAAGHKAFNQARLEGLVSDADVNFATCDGMAESEIEDLYDPKVYAHTC